MNEIVTPDDRLPSVARSLAILGRQSERYVKDLTFRDAVDEVLIITLPLMERAIDEILMELAQ